MPDRHLLTRDKDEEREQRTRLVTLAIKEVGVREKTGNNDGIKVEAYLKSVRLLKGNAWCAAFVSWVYKQAGYHGPDSGWSPSLFPSARCIADPLPGDVMGIHIISLKRIAHVGMVEKIHSDWVYTIEGNTNNSGGREGDGVYRRTRHKKTIRRFSNWIKGGLK